MVNNGRHRKYIEVIHISSDSRGDELQEPAPIRSPQPSSSHTTRTPTLVLEPEPELDEVNEEPMSVTSAIGHVSDSTNLTDSCKRILLLLPQIPYGRYTTYKTLQEHIHATWHMTSVRIIQLSIQKNRYPGIIPCHRVVAGNGGIGRGTEWGDHGFEVGERREMLREEGVRFDKNGRLLGPGFFEFVSS